MCSSWSRPSTRISLRVCGVGCTTAKRAPALSAARWDFTSTPRPVESMKVTLCEVEQDLLVAVGERAGDGVGDGVRGGRVDLAGGRDDGVVGAVLDVNAQEHVGEFLGSASGSPVGSLSGPSV